MKTVQDRFSKAVGGHVEAFRHPLPSRAQSTNTLVVCYWQETPNNSVLVRNGSGVDGSNLALTQGIPAPGLDPVECFKGKHLGPAIHYHRCSNTEFSHFPIWSNTETLHSVTFRFDQTPKHRIQSLSNLVCTLSRCTGLTSTALSRP